MANTKYPKGKEKILNKEIDFDTDTIKAALVDNTAAYNSAHEFWSSLSAKLVGSAVTLTTPSIALGIFDADDVTFSAVSGATPIGAIVLFKDTGSGATSPLIAWIDTVTGGAISVTPNGGDIQITWDNGANKIFAI